MSDDSKAMWLFVAAVCDRRRRKNPALIERRYKFPAANPSTHNL
jgi:hypothetical protein